MCKRATHYIKSLQTGQPALQTEAPQESAEYVLSQFEAQLLTPQTLNESRDKLVQTRRHPLSKLEWPTHLV
jgi:hypothetical protein